MKIKIEADSQEEFDIKRGGLIKAIAGNKFKVSLSPVNETKPGEPKKPFYIAQEQMMAHYNELYRGTIEAILKDIDEVIG